MPALVFCCVTGTALPVHAVSVAAEFWKFGIEACLSEMEEFRLPPPRRLDVGSDDRGFNWCSRTFEARDAEAIERQFRRWATEAKTSGRYTVTDKQGLTLESHLWREPVLQVSLLTLEDGSLRFMVEDLDKEG